MSTAQLRFVVGSPTPPPGKPLSAGEVPADLVLRTATVSQRETLLIGLALSCAKTPRPAGAQDALRRVASEANALALTQTFEAMADKHTLGFVVEQLELEWLLTLCKQRGVAVNDILAKTDSVSRRGLTKSEARRVEENFGGTLDPDSVRFCFTTGVQTMGAGAMVVGNVIHADPTDPRWGLKRGTTLPEEPEDESWDSFNGILLAHEPAHIWSYQHQGSQYAVNSVADQLAAIQQGDRGGAYLYTPGRPHFVDYGEEQRAMIVQDYICAYRGRAVGEATSLTLYAGTQPVDEVVAKLERYIKQMRAMGPGIAEPTGRQPEWIVCAHLRPVFAQDGLAGFLGAHGSVLVAAAGRASTQALVDGVAQRDAGKVAGGLAGVTAAIAASVLPREQNSSGASSGGSAILDQAQIPRGVEVTKDGISGSVKLGWDAPAGGSAPGFKDPRVEWGTGVHKDVGDLRIDADAKAVVATSGEVKEASAQAKVGTDQVALEVAGGVKPGQRAWGHLEFITEPLTVHVGGSTSPRGATVDARVETRGFSPAALPGRGGLQVSAEAELTKAHADAPLAFDSATVGVSGQLSAGVTAGIGAKLVPTGLDEVSAQVAAIGDKGSLSIAAEGTKLQTTPTVGVKVTATDKKTGVAVSGHAEATPGTGEVAGGVNVSIPLPEPGKKK
ncbi:MAG: hypothetical protein JNM17_36980 [Archangium sp.]|nr:hypothetical protein [Archangium sp.]